VRRQALANVLTAVLTVALLTVILLAVTREGDDHPAARTPVRTHPTAVIPSSLNVSGTTPGPPGSKRARLRQAGAVLTGWWHDNYSLPSSDQALVALAQTHANSVAILGTWYMANRNSSTIAPDPSKTPTDASVLHAIATARRLGFWIALKPHVDVDTGSERSLIDPSDPAAWFRSYRRMIVHYADLARLAGVNMMIVGTELGSVSNRTGEWRAVIRTARTRFGGPLTYAAKFDEARRIRFWKALDYIGIDAYLPLATPAHPDPTVAQLVTAWRYLKDQYGKPRHYFDAIRALHLRFRRPVLFPEIGYHSVSGTAIQPGAPNTSAWAGQQEPQRRAFEAAYEFWSKVPWFAGLYWWDWRARSFNPSDQGYNPRGKLAQKTMQTRNPRLIGA
jgi:hypothetical protein